MSKLEGVEFMPTYMDYFHNISKRYIPLQTIRMIPEERAQGKTRHFIYKLCFKFASIQQNEISFTLDECMNLGKFFNKSDRNLQRKWKPIEKALLQAKKLNLFDFEWVFNTPPNKNKDQFSVNLFDEISNPKYSQDNTLQDEYYKHIKYVIIKRIYNLSNQPVDLPVKLEKIDPKREKKGIKAQF